MRNQIKQFFKGEVSDDSRTLENHSHDASLFEIKPKIVVYPKDTEDIKNLIKWVNEQNLKNLKDNKLSITVRSGGTDMSGGPLNDSIILDFKNLNKLIYFSDTLKQITVEPGMFYRDFEKIVSDKNLMLPSYPASKSICTVGGMVANNSGGEKSLIYGKTEEYIEQLKIILNDGEEYTIKSLNKEELNNKISQNNQEGELYRKIYDIIESNREIITEAKPKVSKNSAGYYVWNIEQSSNQFDLSRLITGSQGTLGIVTEITFKLVPIKKYSKLHLVFLKNLEKLPELVNILLKYKPESIESYDDKTLRLALHFLPDFLKNKNILGKIKFLWSFWPDLFLFFKVGIPKIVLMIEFSDDDQKIINEKVLKLKKDLSDLKLVNRFIKSETEKNKYWDIRRESFNLLRKHTVGKRTAPFIDDVIVNPKDLPFFLPELESILNEYKIEYTIAGHAASGNFHIIPLMDMREEKNQKNILDISDKVYTLIKKYNGSITAEHNDGIIRTPYLKQMYDPRIISIFEKIKNIFDPNNIFNPNKKVNGTKEMITKYMIKN